MWADQGTCQRHGDGGGGLGGGDVGGQPRIVPRKRYCALRRKIRRSRPCYRIDGRDRAVRVLLAAATLAALLVGRLLARRRRVARTRARPRATCTHAWRPGATVWLAC